MKPNPKNTKASWLCATENQDNGVVDIFAKRFFGILPNYLKAKNWFELSLIY
jgi:hypothetical protein